MVSSDDNLVHSWRPTTKRKREGLEHLSPSGLLTVTVARKSATWPDQWHKSLMQELPQAAIF
ncbi:hypothetical protein RS3R6_14990 [Pseudomonas atacamensis]|uniref:Uncharacterized protein n=1 Tax=Pseudomonas atacamensis TaxID=2565368 RepID=A0ABQ5PKM0_9PSED|nr:hypothetical protein RS3R1_31110 [Pseudomonas atacamensis]GLH53318.1 hypothetical protein RS3R6_14990 [Pseudomonas atacamensis]